MSRFVLQILLLFATVLFASCGDDPSAGSGQADDPDSGDNPSHAAALAETDDDIDDDDDPPWGDPNRYHWNGWTDPFYEGWFFRVALQDGRSFGFIYSVQNPGAMILDPKGAHVVIARNGGDVVHGSFLIDGFSADRNEFDMETAGNHAKEGHFDGDIYEKGQNVSWDIDYKTIEPWPDTMGGMTNFPGLPVNWYVGALRGRGTGVINWDGERIIFDNADVFQDHNWGDFFPEGYIWMQSQEFPNASDALAVAGGNIGLEAGMFVWRHGDELVEIRSQDLDSIFKFSSDYEKGEVVADIRRKDRRYVVTGFFGDDIPAILPAPRPEGNVPYTRMAMSGRIRVEVLEREKVWWKLVEEVWSVTAGVEMGGMYGPPVGEF